ncbi:hypothetical protein Trydic_g7421 [Trypoxylus dichotomus]
MNNLRIVTIFFAVVLLVTLASSFPVAEESATSEISPVKLANDASKDETTGVKAEATTAKAEATTTPEKREKREARRYDEEESRRKFIASAAFAALG